MKDKDTLIEEDVVEEETVDEETTQEESEDFLVSMYDEEGKNHDFEYLGEVEYQGSSYIVMGEFIDLQEEEVYPIILEEVEENGETVYVTVVDDDLLNKLYLQFQEENPDDFIYE